MIGKHVGYYFGSKLFAAILNLVSMALFVRLAGHEVYGGYIVAMAWAAIAYSVSLQWMRFAFFASYHEDTGFEQIATYFRLLGVGMIIAALLALAVVYMKLAPPRVGAVIYIVVTGLAAYDALHECARIRLKARTVAIGVVVRSILILGLGLAALKLHSSALALTLAFGVAHWGSAIALLPSIREVASRPFSPEAGASLWRSGKPLIPAFAVDSFGLQIDRLQLAHHSGLSDVGPYGAVSDFVRQLMIVGAEAISGAYLALARADAVAGRQEPARQMLGQAFRAYSMLTIFATVFIMHFSKPLLTLLFGSDVVAAIEPILILILATNAIMVFRAYYFAQILFFDRGASLLLISNISHAIAAASLSFLLIPQYGAAGAAIALLSGHIVALSIYAWSWRSTYVMRMPYRDALAILICGVVLYFCLQEIDYELGNGFAALIISAILFAIVSIAVAWRFRVLSINELLKAVYRHIFRRREGSLV